LCRPDIGKYAYGSTDFLYHPLFAGIVPVRHPVDPEKSNRVLGFPSLITGFCQFYGVPVTPDKVIRSPANQAFIKKYYAPRQAQGKTPQQPGDGWQRATNAPPPPLEFTSAHPQKG